MLFNACFVVSCLRGIIINFSWGCAHFLLPIHDFRENGSTCITLRQSVSASVRQCVSPSVRHTFVSTITLILIK